MDRSLELHMQKVSLVQDQGDLELLRLAALPLLPLKLQLLLNSMMLLDGPQRNTIQMKSNPLLHKSRVKLHIKMMLLLHNLGLCGTKPLAIIMMLLLGSTMTEIQVYTMMVTVGFGIHMITRLNNMFPAVIRMTKQLRNKLKMPSLLMDPMQERLLYLHLLL
nr:uncharacterized protein LOC107764838 [Ipomoea batatas]